MAVSQIGIVPYHHIRSLRFTRFLKIYSSQIGNADAALGIWVTQRSYQRKATSQRDPNALKYHRQRWDMDFEDFGMMEIDKTAGA